MHSSRVEENRSYAGVRLKNVLFTVAVTTVFALGIYSLFLASVNADKMQPLTTEGLLRTATAGDAEQIEITLGSMIDQDLVYVILDTPEEGPDPYVETAALGAARILSDSGLAVSVRVLDPGNPDFTTIVSQNSISRFPAVLAVKRDGGIVLVTADLNEKNLLHAYHAVWGKSSSCDEAKSAVY